MRWQLSVLSTSINRQIWSKRSSNDKDIIIRDADRICLRFRNFRSAYYCVVSRIASPDRSIGILTSAWNNQHLGCILFCVGSGCWQTKATKRRTNLYNPCMKTSPCYFRYGTRTNKYTARVVCGCDVICVWMWFVNVCQMCARIDQVGRFLGELFWTSH